MSANELNTQQWRDDYKEFQEATRQFYAKEMDVKTYKGISGGFGSYAQRGAQASMLRLRMPGGRIDKTRLKFLADMVEKYQVNKVHFTTCQTVQFHNLDGERVCSLALEALDNGIVTRGGGGDFPRNVMVSPLSGVEQGEYFDVLPYAMEASNYLLGLIKAPKLPRKLKVCFSNGPANIPHATFRDLGFVAAEDGTFDVYSAGGLGNNPAWGVKVAQKVNPDQILYYIKAMHDLFRTYGNYENRAKARTRYMQQTLGGADNYRQAFQEKLKAVYDQGEDMTIHVTAHETAKTGDGTQIQDARVVAQKQPGLYAVHYHPIGGGPNPDFFGRLWETVRDMEDIELRLCPDESVYIINCTGEEAARVLKVTEDGARTRFEESVACIGAEICQQGIRDSQGLLHSLVEMERRENFPDGVLPQIHISGCPSSCGTHQIGQIGFQGCVKVVDKVPQPAFTLFVNGCDRQGAERMGEKLGVMLQSRIPDFLCAVGRAVQEKDGDFSRWMEADPEEFKKIAQEYFA